MSLTDTGIKSLKKQVSVIEKLTVMGYTLR